MIKITFEFPDAVAAGRALALLSGGSVAVADAPNAVKAVSKPAQTGQAAAAKPTPAPAPAASSPAPTESAEVTPADLTKAIVAAVTRTSRDKVVDHLKTVYGVGSGKEITDPEIRAAALDSVSAL